MLKYQAVMDDIRQHIEDGTYPAYSQLPPISQLCEQYAVSKITVKKAMDELEAEGYISRRRGSGSFVKRTQPRGKGEFSGQMEGFMREHRARDEKVTSKVIDFSVIHPSVLVARALDIDVDAFVYHIIRVRLADDKPLAIEYTHMPIDVIPDLKARTLEASIYSYIEDELGLKIASAHRTIRACLPSELEQRELKAKKNDPLLEVEQVAFLDDGRAFEHSISRHTKGYEFYTVSTR